MCKYIACLLSLQTADVEMHTLPSQRQAERCNGCSAHLALVSCVCSPLYCHSLHGWLWENNLTHLILLLLIVTVGKILTAKN